MAVSQKHLTNHKPSFHHWLVLVFMASCFAIAWWLTPHFTWFEHLGKPKFENVVPKKFADWEEVSSEMSNAIVDPEQQDALNNLYTQIVSRTYLQKSSGRLVMMSLAYGDNQTFSKQLHRPEACYSSQGFKIEKLREENAQILGKSMTLNRMTGVIGTRQEHVTYWIRIGDRVISGPAHMLNIARISMGLKGYVADGLLFRVSEISDDDASSNKLQNQFLNDFLKALSPAQQAMMIGQSTL